MPCKAAIFDLDGVITKTAKVHANAWEKMFNEFLEGSHEGDTSPFSRADYLQYVDGKPRYEGVASFLESRKISLPLGTVDDEPSVRTISGLGNLKNEVFSSIIKNDGVEIYSSTVEFIKTLREKGVRVGVASSSKNCKMILEVTGLEPLFETRIDGVVSAERGLKGKPQPDIFLTAARELDTAPDEAMVIEDAVSGVEAGSSGKFKLVLGLAREENNEELKKAGAHLVLNDMEEFNWKKLQEWFS